MKKTKATYWIQHGEWVYPKPRPGDAQIWGKVYKTKLIKLSKAEFEKHINNRSI